MDDVSFKKELTVLMANKKALGRTKDTISIRFLLLLER